MTKQEEIREGIAWRLLPNWVKDEELEGDIHASVYWLKAKNLILYLHSQGVVLRVERELPKAEFKYHDEPTHKLFTKQAEGIKIGAEMMKHNFVEAGYVAVESLIKEA